MKLNHETVVRKTQIASTDPVFPILKMVVCLYGPFTKKTGNYPGWKG